MLKLKKDIEIESLDDDEILIINVNEGTFLNINKIGLAILEALINGSNINEIVIEMSKKFSKDLKECENIIIQFVEKLKNFGIVE